MRLTSALYDHTSLASASGTVLLVAILGFLVRLYHARSTIWKLQRQGLVFLVLEIYQTDY